MKSRLRTRSASARTIIRKFELRLPSVPRNIGQVESFLNEIGDVLNIDDGTMYRVHIAATEAVNNAILHGNSSDPEKSVHIRCQATKSCLSFRIADEGRGFDSDHLPNPVDEKNLLKEHGRGVFLMRSMMDDVRFRRLKVGSVVHMRICYNR